MTDARKTRELTIARDRVAKVANGYTINGTYRMAPGEALDAFKADLRVILAALPS